MRGWRWINGTTMGLVTIALCIKIAIDKMQLCLLSVAYVCPYHNPTATMGHSAVNSRPLARTTPYTLSAICLVQMNRGFFREEHTSPMCQWPSKVSFWPLKSVTTPNCSQVKTLLRTMSTRMSFSETVSAISAHETRDQHFACCIKYFGSV